MLDASLACSCDTDICDRPLDSGQMKYTQIRKRSVAPLLVLLALLVTSCGGSGERIGETKAVLGAPQLDITISSAHCAVPNRLQARARSGRSVSRRRAMSPRWRGARGALHQLPGAGIDPSAILDLGRREVVHRRVDASPRSCTSSCAVRRREASSTPCWLEPMPRGLGARS